MYQALSLVTPERIRAMFILGLDLQLFFQFQPPDDRAAK